jgi:uncharacterized protein YraI
MKNISPLMRLLILAACLSLLAACAPAPTPTPAPTTDVAAIQTQAVQDAYAGMTAAAPSSTPPPPEPALNSALPVAVVPTAVTGQPSGTALYNASIMSGPSTNYVLYGVLLGGATVQVIGKNQDGTYWVISVPPAPLGQGWVSAKYLSTTNTQSVPVVATPPVPPTTSMVPPGANDPQATALANVYVRNGPGTNYPAYGMVPTGSAGRVIGVSQDNAWWVVRLNPNNVGTGYGWVSKQYTSSSNTQGVPVIANPATAAPVVPATPPTGAPTATAVEYVNVRTGPGTNYPVLGVASPGASAQVTGKSADGGWWQVSIPTTLAASGFGWVSASYVVTSNTGSVPVVSAPPAPPTVPATPPPPASGVSCVLVSQSPADGTTLTIGSPFTTTWVLKNTGGVAWNSSTYDVVFTGALNNVWLHTGPDLYDLNTTVNPGQTYNFSVPMLAPTFTGTYGESWQIADGNGKIACQFYVYITVP